LNHGSKESCRGLSEGSGSAELLEDGSLKIELDYQHGDEASLKAERATSSAAC